MTCAACSATTIPIDVPERFRERLPGDPPAVAVCTQCLTMAPTEEADDENGVRKLSDALPEDPAAAIPLVLAVGLSESFAIHRATIEELLAAVEAAGTDPLLAFDRLAADPDLDPAVDLERRRSQIAQLLE